MGKPPVVRLRGEGSVVWELELPLSEVFADQVRTRKLTPVDEDAYELVADLLVQETDETAAEPAPGDGSFDERIEAVSTHAEANALAAELDVDGFEEKKPSLGDKKAALREAAAARASE